MADQTVSVIGCGWLGMPLVKQLLAEGFRVKGSTTSRDKVSILSQAGVEAYQLELRPNPVGDLTALVQADTLIVDIPPRAGKVGDAFHPQQIQYLRDATRQSPIKHVIYVSSTSIYPEWNRIVTEEEITESGQSAAPALVQAEQLMRDLSPERTVTILRCGGLMGYDRIPGKYVAGRTVDSGTVPVNYLHRDDAVAILLTIIQQQMGGIFNAVAPEHPTREAIYQKSCADFGYELPTFVSPTEPVPYKIISNGKLVQATNYTFKYPNPLQFFYRQ